MKHVLQVFVRPFLVFVICCFGLNMQGFSQELASVKSAQEAPKQSQQQTNLEKPQSLIDMLGTLEDQHQVKFDYEKEQLKDMFLDSGASIRFSQDLEENLSQILGPFKLEFKKYGADSYLIYHKARKKAAKKVKKIRPKAFQSDKMDATAGFNTVLEKVSSLKLADPKTVYDQQVVVNGRVIDENGDPLPGVNVVVKNTSTGAVTDANGRYSVNMPAGTDILIFTFVGYHPEEVAVNGRTVVDMTLYPDILQLQEVVVTGVAGTLPKEKLSFTVDKLNEDIIQSVPGVNPARAIQGKVAGVKIGTGSGAPGANQDIQLRGATNIFGSSNPLIIVDGILTEGSLNDINAEDIASIEIVKGAAASSLYGSRAANGVVNIITKRGKGLDVGTTEVFYRTEVGQSSIGFVPEKTTSTNFVMENGEVQYDQPEPDGIYDNPYPRLTDPLDQFFNPGFYTTQYLSFKANSEGGNTALFTSIQYTDEEGVVELTDGQQRVNLRANIDHHFSERFKFTTSNLYSQNTIDRRADGIWDMFYYADPDVDFLAPNEEDGSPYNHDPNQLGKHENPLYSIANSVNEEDRNRFLGHYGIQYNPSDFLELKLAYGLDRIQSEVNSLTPKGKLVVDAPPSTGSIFRSTSSTFAQTLQADAFIQKTFGDFNTRFNLQYLYESNEFNYFSASGSQLSLKGLDVPNLDLASENLDIYSVKSLTVANNISAMAFVDFRDKYILDALIRRDGVSLFGGNERWQTFYRIAGAWRLTQDFSIPNVQELKLRTSYGVAGLRPPFEAQYEVVGVENGNVTNPATIGNEDLTSSFSRELEIGFDMSFLGRFSLSANYARAKNTDQILNVPVSAATGFVSQWQNAGDLESTAIEFNLGVDLIKKNDLQWRVNLLWDRVRQKVIKLNRSGYAIVSGGIFRIAEGEAFGTLYGRDWATSLDEVANQVPEGETLEEYFVVNNEGFVVRTTDIGTTAEVPIQIRDENNVPVETRIGDVNPDFTLNFNSTLTYKNFNFFALLSWQQGGDIYNHMRRYMLVHNVGQQLDQRGKSPNAVKSARYYQELTTWNNSHFVEDATFVRLREIALTYTLRSEVFDKVGIDNIKVGVIGRNLFTLTNYAGFNPEAGRSQEGVDSNVLKFDLSSYPVYRTITGTVGITF